MSSDIPLIPDLPKQIIDAVNNDKLCIFIGAGISRLEGCIGWDSLGKTLIHACYVVKAGEKSLISYREYDTLNTMTDHRKVISICYNILKNNGRKNVFYSEMKKALLYNKKVKGIGVYKELSNIKALFVTTNADELFDKYFHKDRILFSENDYKEENDRSGYLLHIHGCIRYKESLIFTLKDYIRKYSKEMPLYELMNKVFKNKTILFLGYGLAEFELLSFLLQGAENEESTPKHYLLKGFFKGEEQTLINDQHYHKELNINIIPYLMDEGGYQQQITIIKDWANQIRMKTLVISDSLRIIDEAVR